MSKIHNSCYIERDKSTHLKRCFMTGEYCSKQRNIQVGKQKIVKEVDGKKQIEIKAFVVMNFSDMSDVVYKYHIKPYIESLTKYLYYDIAKDRIVCYAESEGEEYYQCASESNAVEKTERTNLGQLAEIFFDKAGMIDENHRLLKKVDRIKADRSDSSPTSNYVVCGRICQQLQMADLVVVDVSFENVNVFYEFGMAVAQEKMILPICYSQSFYKLNSMHEEHTKKIFEPSKTKYADYTKVKSHIDYYSWRRTLYEHFGLKYVDDQTEYINVTEAVKEIYGFSDNSYVRFPYVDDNKDIGTNLYRALQAGYSYGVKKHQKFEEVGCCDTVIIYTPDRFLNGRDTGHCIVNFYRNITRKMHHDKDVCFVGNRIAVLSRNASIYEPQKDADSFSESVYPIGEIIRMGINQATNRIFQQEVWPSVESNALKTQFKTIVEATQKGHEQDGVTSDWKNVDDINEIILNYRKNRGVLYYPQYPLYVDRLTVLQADLKAKIANRENITPEEYFCLYHIMLSNLSNVDEIAVDITDNYVQNLFWLGVAHSSGLNAITIKHERTHSETLKHEYPESRNIFDVSGLWTAIFNKNDTYGFYKQLEEVQRGIELNAKRIFDDTECREISEDGASFLDPKTRETVRKEVLESYYRRRFWNPLIRYNKLNLYVEEKPTQRHGRSVWDTSISKNDLNAVAALSNYLSKRTIIGEYNIFPIVDSERVESRPDRMKGESISLGGNGIERDTSDVQDKMSVDNNSCIIVGDNILVFEKPSGEKTDTDDSKDKMKLVDYISRNLNQGNTDGQSEGSGGRLDRGDTNRLLVRAKWEGCAKENEGLERICEDSNKKCLLTRSFRPQQERGNSGEFEKLSSRELIDCIANSRCQNPDKFAIGQLILWREGGGISVTKDENKKVTGKDITTRFRVGLNGGSGFATHGMALLFVDEEQRNRAFDIEEYEGHQPHYYLSEMQEIIRGKILKVFVAESRKYMMKLGENGEYKNDQAFNSNLIRIAYAYLTTILPQYFSPFHLKRDIYRISNGLYHFLLFVYKSNPHLFGASADSKELTKYAEEAFSGIMWVIRDTLVNMRGVEIYYKVAVNELNNNKCYDDRKARDIELWPEDPVYYIFNRWKLDEGIQGESGNERN